MRGRLIIFTKPLNCFIQMVFSFGEVNYQEVKKLTLISTKFIVGFLILIYFAGRLVICNKDIPVCDESYKKLGEEMKDWRKRCLNGSQELNSTCCKAEKGYSKERIRIHKKMCFYEGTVISPCTL